MDNIGQIDFVNSCLQTMKGGEIFIPKIPSMKIVDFVKAIGPNCSLKVIGIRPLKSFMKL